MSLRKERMLDRRVGYVLVVFAVAAPAGDVFASSAARSRGPLPPPSFRSSASWITLTTGSAADLGEAPPSVWALTARSNLAALAPFDFAANLRHLSRDAIYISASTDGRGGATKTFARSGWPLRLARFRVDRGWEGQPASNIQQRLGWLSVQGWHLDVRLYFATQHPSMKLLRRAQRELDRLRLP